MALSDFLDELQQLASQAEAAFDAAQDESSLEAARVEFLGAKSGRLKAVQKGLGRVDKPDKPAAGKQFNEVKSAIEQSFEAAASRLEGGAAAGDISALDVTLPGTPLALGHVHPITQTIEDLKEIMGRLGFSVASGPEVEDTRHNFEALNIPREHPARDPLDNFYLAAAEVAKPGRAKEPSDAEMKSPSGVAASVGSDPLLLRSQTSTVQIRVMESTPPPVRIISLGRVYRPDTADATHYPMFHQVEGLLVDRHVTMADLKSVLRLFAQSYFHDDVHIRFRPSFFPFTEPSVEVDMSWKGGWMEMGGAGMVDPHVLEAVGYDPDEVTGFAFGLGVERICMNRYKIDDIRELFRNDVRFLRQF